MSWIEWKKELDSIFFFFPISCIGIWAPSPGYVWEIVRVTFLSRMSGASDILQVPRMVVSAPPHAPSSRKKETEPRTLARDERPHHVDSRRVPFPRALVSLRRAFVRVSTF